MTDSPTASRFCGGCGSPLQSDNRFCTSCGCPLPVYEAAPARCAACGATLQEGLRFCTQCGQAVPEATTASPAAGPPRPSAGSHPSAAPPSMPPTAPMAPPPAALASQSLARTGRPSVAPLRGEAPHAGKSATQPAPRITVGGTGMGKRLLLFAVALLLIALGLRIPLLAIAGSDATGTVTRVSGPDDDDQYTIGYTFAVAGNARHGSYTMHTLNTSLLPSRGTSVGVRYLPSLPAINMPAKDAKIGLGMIVLLGLGAAVAVASIRMR